MLIATGTALVLLTWIAGIAGLTTAGLPLALATAPWRDRTAVLRAAMWWGLLIITVTVYVTHIFAAMHAPMTAVVVAVLVVIAAAIGLPLLRRRPARSAVSLQWPDAALLVAFALATTYLAAAALGPVTNFDSGLYHLNAVQYAAEFPAVPGLANVFFPLGYGNAEFPLAALLGNGPWGAEGYRLLNGLLMAAAVTELTWRLQRRRRTAGTFVLLAGMLAGWVPMVALSDYWVTSPTQDSAVLVLTLVASAYLVDGIAGSKSWLADVATALALSVTLVLFRPTMAVFALAVLVIAVVLAWRRRRSLDAQRPGCVLTIVVGAGLVAGTVATVRDVLLSGWLQFPLSVHAFDVAWRAPDPTQYRDATLGYHRNPDDLWGSVEGWAWVGPWLHRLPSQWEPFEFAGLIAVAVVAVILAARLVAAPHRLRAMTLAMAPSALALAAWWLVSPPSFRFAWGPLITLPSVAIGWSAWLLITRPTKRPHAPTQATWWRMVAVVTAVPIVLVTAYSAVARFDHAAITAERSWNLGVSIPYAVAPVQVAPVTPTVLPSGVTILQPDNGLCWTAFPLCTYDPAPGLRMLGPSIDDGFASDG